MHASTAQPNKVDNKLLIGAAVALFLMSLPSIFILAKVAIGLAMLSLGIITFKVTLKVMLNTLEESEADKNHAIRNKIVNITIGLTSILVGGLSLLIMAKTGLIAVCAAFTALVLHEYTKSEEKEAAKKDQPTSSNEKDGLVDMTEESELVQNKEQSRCINETFNKIADRVVKEANSFANRITGERTQSESIKV